MVIRNGRSSGVGTKIVQEAEEKGEIAATEVSTSGVDPAARALDVLGGERILRQARGHGGNKER